jgi:hypothetical protein
MRSPWRRSNIHGTEKSTAMREAFNQGWDITDPATGHLIGISMMPAPPFQSIRAFLVSAGWDSDQIKQIQHPNDAAAVRQAGGLVVHVEPAERPRLVGSITSAGIECLEGDFVLERAINPGEYLPRLLGRLSRLSHE